MNHICVNIEENLVRVVFNSIERHPLDDHQLEEKTGLTNFSVVDYFHYLGGKDDVAKATYDVRIHSGI